MLRMGRHTVIPGDFMGVRSFAPASAAPSGWWVVAGKTCVAAYQPKGADDIADSYVNLANPGTYNCTAPVAAPTFNAATGWTFNGSTQFLVTGVIPEGDQTWSAAVAFSDATSNNAHLIGVHYGSTYFLLRPKSDDNAMWGNVSLGTDAGAMGSGVMAIAGRVGYRDGTAEVTVNATSASWQIYTLYIGVANALGELVGYQDGTIKAIAIYSDTLNGTEVAALSTRMAAL